MELPECKPERFRGTGKAFEETRSGIKGEATEVVDSTFTDASADVSGRRWNLLDGRGEALQAVPAVSVRVRVR